MRDDIDHALLASYLAGECTPAEQDEVRAWIAASLENASTFQELEALWRTAQGAAVDWNVDGAWNRVRREFHEQPKLTLTAVGANDAESAPAAGAEQRDRSRHRTALRFMTPLPRWRAVVAAVLAITASVVMWGRLGQPGERGKPLPMRTIATVKGQQTSARLSDGTRVSLGVDSRLYFPPAFGVTTRDVFLDGEAFFEVAHDPNKPFVVHAARSVTRVLGTKFDVRAYAGEPEVRVAVVEGRVQFRAEHADSAQGVILTRNQLGRLGADDDIAVRRDVDARSYARWVDGQIAFDDAPLREVLDELQHWYSASLIVADPGLDSLRFTATFGQEPLDVITRAIARALDLDVQRTGSAVVFSRHPRSHR